MAQRKRTHKRLPLFSAVALLVGSIVGAGIFALPAAFVRVGFLLGSILFLAVGVLSYVLHLLFAEVVLRAKDGHQFAGLAEHALGKPGKMAAMVASLAGGYGAMVAYVIAVGAFFHLLLGPAVPLPALFYSTVFALLGFVAVAGGLSVVVAVQRIMLVFLVGVLIFFLFAGFPHIQLANLFGEAGSWSDTFSLYGALLFAFMGTGAIVDMEQILVHDKRQMLPAIRIGFLIAAIFYALFVATVVGVSGSATSSEAITGLAPFIGSSILVLGALFGITSMSTSFLSIGLQLRGIFDLDLHMPRWFAAVLACVPPYLFFLFGLADFGRAVELTGAVAVGATVILILAMHTRMKKLSGDRPPFTVSVPPVLRWVLYVLLLSGIVYAAFPTLFRALSRFFFG